MPTPGHLPSAIAAGTAFRRRRLFAVLFGLPLFGQHTGFAADTISKEYRLKAAFLYNFTKFVAWPPASSGDALVIGVLGRNPFGEELEKIARGRTAGGREIRVRSLSSLAEASSVSMLFIPAGEERRVAGQLDSLHSSAVLTVGETSQFGIQGGIITFSMEVDKIRFEINRQAAIHAALKISPQLLKLAISERHRN